MGLRTQLVLIVIGALILSLGALFLSYQFIATRVTALLPEGMAETVVRNLHVLLLEQAAFTMLFSVVVALGSYWVLSNFFIMPVRKIVIALEAFIARGERIALPVFRGAPKEIQALSTGLENFAARVEESHVRDVEISRVKSDFISTAAHQFRTPLTGIRWALEALEKENLTESQKALVKSATEKSHDLVSIVGTLLDISSIESGKYKYSWEQVDMQNMLETMARDFAPLASQRQVTLFYAKESNPHPKVRADKERIKWVLNNLVENAIQYTPAGGTVRLSIQEVPGRLMIRVRDTGIGIKPEDRGNIFERFYRAPNAISVQNKGNGLGLYIARTIATDHGGDLNFTANEEGPGTTFTLSLPVSG